MANTLPTSRFQSLRQPFSNHLLNYADEHKLSLQIEFQLTICRNAIHVLCLCYLWVKIITFHLVSVTCHCTTLIFVNHYNVSHSSSQGISREKSILGRPDHQTSRHMTFVYETVPMHLQCERQQFNEGLVLILQKQAPKTSSLRGTNKNIV